MRQLLPQEDAARIAEGAVTSKRRFIESAEEPSLVSDEQCACLVGEHIAVFLIGLLLIGAGIYLLTHKQINAAIVQTAKDAKTGAEAAAL